MEACRVSVYRLLIVISASFLTAQVFSLHPTMPNHAHTCWVLRYLQIVNRSPFLRLRRQCYAILSDSYSFRRIYLFSYLYYCSFTYVPVPLILLWAVRYELKKKLHGLSPRVNYTDRAIAACRRSDCQLLRWCHVVSVIHPYCRILGFLDRSRYFSIK
jgi:hypothetical protein